MKVQGVWLDNRHRSVDLFPRASPRLSRLRPCQRGGSNRRPDLESDSRSCGAKRVELGDGVSLRVPRGLAAVAKGASEFGLGHRAPVIGRV